MNYSIFQVINQNIQNGILLSTKKAVSHELIIETFEGKHLLNLKIVASKHFCKSSPIARLF